jgi:hypothetical protein
VKPDDPLISDNRDRTRGRDYASQGDTKSRQENAFHIVRERLADRVVEGQALCVEPEKLVLALGKGSIGASYAIPRSERVDVEHNREGRDR